MLSADVNADGLLDLVASYDGSGGFDLFLAFADGGLSAAVNYPGTTSPVIAVADINQDGWPDLVVSDALALDINLYLNNGTGAFIRSSSIPTTFGYATAIGVGDFNADGFPDIVVSEFLTSAQGTATEVFLGGLAGSFKAPVTLTGLQGTFPFLDEQLLVADLNNDGLPDIIASYAPDESHRGQVAVLIGQSDGGFQMTTYPDMGSIALLSQMDGLPDMLVVQYNGIFGLSYLQVLLNAAGIFRQGELYGIDAGGGGLEFTVGDFNGDCVPDVVTTTMPENGCGATGAKITVIYGDGKGGFGPPQALPLVGSAPFLAAPLGPVTSPRALAVFDSCGAGITVYGDASRH